MTTESTEGVPPTTHVVPRPHGARRTFGAPPPQAPTGPRPLVRPGHPRRDAVLLGTADSLATLTVTLAATLGAGEDGGRPLPAPAAGLLWLVFCLLGPRTGAYRPGLDPHALAELPGLAARAAVAWCVTAALLAGLAPGAALTWTTLLAAIAAHTALACALRGLSYAARRHDGRRRPRAALVVGDDATARAVAAALVHHPRYGLRPVAHVDLRPLPDGVPEAGPQVLRTWEGVLAAVVRHHATDIVFPNTAWRDAPHRALARRLAGSGLTGWLVGAGPLAAPARPDHVWGFACRRLELDGPHTRGRRAKRALDVVLVAPALLAAAPVMGLCALALRWSDGPGVLFRQERVGRHGRPFTLLKFRTLRPADDHESATRWSVADDSRMSRTGALLRRTSLDELPQLWNVLRGDMSLVGPRPERPYFVQQFSRAHPGYEDRHRVPVGITGLAQTHGLRGDTSIADRARFDNHYIDTWSLWQDVRILWRTAVSVLRLEGR